MWSVLRKLKKIIPGTKADSQIIAPPEEIITDSIFNNYSFIIGGHIKYFYELSEDQKRVFVQRVHKFIRTKKFHYIGLEEREEIPVLVAASAVQVTFGLNNYLLQHFTNIYILADAYRMDTDEELYIGHVAPDGIYLSWKHFLFGYSNNADNVNVGVHEISHALLYNNFFAQYGIDTQFRLNYEKFSTTTGPILADVITRRRSYLRSYAFSNLHEFWAVSVEAFFENPRGLRLHMPQLYDALCRVLNQDPLSKNKILKQHP